MGTITVVVPVYNKASYIKEALQSIYRQTFRDWTLLIIDDASGDDTVSIARGSIVHDRARIITLRRNMGICHVLNLALELIDTPYFIQLDGDDWLEPEALEMLYGEMLRCSPSTALVYGDTCYWHEINGVLKFRKMVNQRVFRDRYDFAAYDPMVQPRFYKTSCVREVGGWEIDELTGGRLMEDRRMLLSLLDRYSFAHVKRVLYHYRYHQHNLSQQHNIPLYNQLRKKYTEQALLRWGNNYKAEMTGLPNQWQSISLVPVSGKGAGK